MTNALTALSVAARAETATPYYGLVWLALANLAYTDEAGAVIRNVATDLAADVTALPDPPAPPGLTASSPWGRWGVEWGPVVTSDNGNLMYVASYRELQSGAPVFAAVCIRGTDTQSGKFAGVLQQIYEDLDVGHKVPWSSVMDHPDSPCGNGGGANDVAIAKGTCEGLKTLRKMQSNGIDILTAVRTLVQADSDLPIIVTGHSLGGCQATVMAAFLGDALAAEGVAARIVPHAFAPPSAGTPAFAAKFTAQFPAAHLWWNTLDVVPNAFQNVSSSDGSVPSLTNIKSFWHDHGGPKIEFALKLALDGFIHIEHSYAQPAANLVTLKGSVVVPGATAGCKNDWSTQLMIQHFAPQYHYLISTQLAGAVAPYPLTGTSGPCFQVPPLP